MTSFLRLLFFILFVSPITFIVLGLNIRGRENLPSKGPAILIANHNSHLDTLVLMSLFRVEDIRKIRPIAAEEYFMRNKFLSWFSEKMIGIIPFKRNLSAKGPDPFQQVKKALQRKEIVILFPEGSRGKPEQLSPMKTGIAHLAKELPEVPIIPIFLSGLGKSLPKGDPILIPFHVNVNIGTPLDRFHHREELMRCIRKHFDQLQNELL